MSFKENMGNIESYYFLTKDFFSETYFYLQNFAILFISDVFYKQSQLIKTSHRNREKNKETDLESRRFIILPYICTAELTRQ